MSSRALAAYRLFDEATSSKQKIAARNLEGIDEVYELFSSRYADFSPLQAAYIGIGRGLRQSEMFRSRGMDEAAEAAHAYCVRKISAPDTFLQLLTVLNREKRTGVGPKKRMMCFMHTLRKKMQSYSTVISKGTINSQYLKGITTSPGQWI